MPKVLRPWLWTVIWLAVFWCGYFYLELRQNQLLQEELLVKLDKLSASSVNAQKTSAYIVLGDSLLAYSLPSEASFQKELGSQVLWLQYWFSNATWQEFTVFSGIRSKSMQRTTFYIQDSLFLHRRQIRFSERLRRIKDAIIKKESLGAALLTDMYHQSRKEGCSVVYAYDNDKFIAQYTYKDHILTKDSKKFLHDLKVQSKQVVVLAIPRAKNNIERLQINWRNQLQTELKREGISLITLGPSMPADYYCDGNHPNNKGREVRTMQMQSLIKRIEASTP